MTDPEVYRPLDKTSNSIRLLTILPSEDERIHCHLEVVALEDVDNSYVALSYAWGAAGHGNAILVNGHKFSVSSNLFDFLSGLVAIGDHRERYWIDQVCINQNDTCEKESQVAMMHLVYSSAMKTIIWLGRDPHHGLAIFRLTMMMPLMLAEPSKDEIREYWSHNVSADEREAITYLVRLPYWTRHWILQELCLSETKIFMYGADKIEWIILWELLHDLHFTSPKEVGVGLEPMATRDVWQLFDLVDRYIQGKLRSFMDIWNAAMYFAAHSKCQDMRDKLYGTQSLFPTDFRIETDYRSSARDVYLSTVKHIFMFRDEWQLSFLASFACLAIGMDLVSESVACRDIAKLARTLHAGLDDLFMQRGLFEAEISVEDVIEVLESHLLKPASIAGDARTNAIGSAIATVQE